MALADAHAAAEGEAPLALDVDPGSGSDGEEGDEAMADLNLAEATGADGVIDGSADGAADGVVDGVDDVGADAAGGNPNPARLARLARKAEAARVARLRHKQFVQVHLMHLNESFMNIPALLLLTKFRIVREK